MKSEQADSILFEPAAAGLPAARFPALDCLAELGFRHAFALRAPGVDVTGRMKDEVIELLESRWAALISGMGFSRAALRTAEQVHGDGIASVGASGPSMPVRDADGLISNQPGTLLGIHVADCAAVYLVDGPRRAWGLVHSGRRGTELEIARRAIERMEQEFGTEPADLVVQLSPCIRPPAYEVDFAAAIREQCATAGVPRKSIHDAGECTARDPERYYSYRREKGKTGRMFALLGLLPGGKGEAERQVL